MELARQYGRYGYRKIAELLRRAGWLINDKRVERIWRREGLKVPARQPKRGRLGIVGSFVLRPVSSLSAEPIAEDDGELGPGLEPLARRPFPFVGLAIEDQI